MLLASHPDRRLSALHIFKIYYPDLFGGILPSSATSARR